MKSQILSQVIQVFITAFVGALIVLIKNVGDMAIQYLKSKKESVEKQLKFSTHTEELNTAKEIWNIVEEKYRVTDSIKDLANSKADEFDKLLLKKIPYLTEEQVKDLRQAIAGEINKGKALLNENSLKQQANNLINENAKLKDENEELKNKLNAISSCIPK